MKFLKILFISIIAIVALLLLIAAFTSKDFNYETSIVINKPMDSVWKNVNSFAAQNSWSPWNAYDPNMKRTFTGTDGTVGATFAWESPVQNVGFGNQTISVVDVPKSIQTKLEFTKPYKTLSDTYINLNAEGAGTKVTWGFKSKMPFPTNILKLFMNLEKAMDKDFGTGLKNLKALSEK